MTITLIALLALALWVLSLYVRPFGPCPRCHGKRTVMRGSQRKTRAVTCTRCKGAGRRQRPGSRLVHSLARRVRAYRCRQHRERTATAKPEE
jgi:DnaJ-class molecular chaperone